MSQSQPIASPNEYADMILEVGLIMDIGKPPRLNNKNQYGLNYSKKYVEYLEKKVKALAKAHLYLASLKSKFQQIENYLRWHPNAKNAQEYKSLLDSYHSQFDYIRQQLKSEKEVYLPLAKNELQMAEVSKTQHETVEVPAAKLALEELNRQNKAYKAQSEMYDILKTMEKKEYNEAKSIQNARLRETGIEPMEENQANRKEVNAFHAQREKEANEARLSERQKLVNVSEGKFEGWNETLRKRSEKYGLSYTPLNYVDPNVQKVEANRQARLNALRARKQNRTLAKQSQRRNTRKTRKNR